MKYTYEEHNKMINEILDIVQTPEQVKFITSLEYEISHKQVHEAQQQSLRYQYELSGMEKALRIVTDSIHSRY